ncbi:hypothetical protein [Natrialba sp. INN-245]|uniref:hypothetical protein n=1 Tax=Natrialba sp. INN-245 TaxID=2690967 RepID=UPI00130F9D9B|nr:hypothetical protein [Natrialba sp. INN-245]MWV38815.1 hypothetical protein [Natrialba sp. INN-245]
MTPTRPSTRRTLLCGIATSAAISVSGCFNRSETGSEVGWDNPTFEDISVDGTELVLEFDDDASVDQVNVIDPNGELYTELSVPAGVSRETVEIGTSYQPGEYEVVALVESNEQDIQTVNIEPDIQITDLRLGRNHPDEMFEGASDNEIRSEAILTLENTGTGPDAATRLSFEGDIPRETPSDYDESGIQDIEDDVSRYADAVDLPPGEEIFLYSRRRPFSSASERVSCTHSTEEGVFDVAVNTTNRDEPITETFSVSYTGENLVECDIEVEVI